MNPFFETIKEGQLLMAKKQAVSTEPVPFTACNPHINTDGSEPIFIVYDETGTCYFEEDIDIPKSLSLLQENKEQAKNRIVFSKFNIPPNITSVQAVLICTTDEGKTWSKQIPAELTIACPAEIEYLPVSGNKHNMKHLAHNFIENTWRNGFNTCLELFKTGRITENDTNTDQI